MEFKKEFTLAQRKMESDRVLTKYPDRIPIICERSNKSKMESLDKKKYLVPVDLTTGQFVFIIRRRLQLPAEKAIFLFIGPVIPPSNATVQEVYQQYKDKDGFLYIQYSEENVFGGGSGDGPPNTWRFLTGAFLSLGAIMFVYYYQKWFYILGISIIGWGFCTGFLYKTVLDELQ